MQNICLNKAMHDRSEIVAEGAESQVLQYPNPAASIRRVHCGRSLLSTHLALHLCAWRVWGRVHACRTAVAKEHCMLVMINAIEVRRH
jgi:hypothetical protein